MTEKELINDALPTSGHLPMYVMHKFFARKQEDVIREYIQTFSKKGDIVCDPFCGSGVMIGEAIRLERKAVGVDINPVSIFITRNTLKHVSNIDRIFEEFDQRTGRLAGAMINAGLKKGDRVAILFFNSGSLLKPILLHLRWAW